METKVDFVEIMKRPGQTLGLYIREGNGVDRGDGVFISRIALESPVYGSGCLRVGDEILAVNLVDVTRMSLDDVVIIMSIPRRLVLTTRRCKPSQRAALMSPPPMRSECRPPPVVVMKKIIDEPDEENNHLDYEPDFPRYGSLGRPRNYYGGRVPGVYRDYQGRFQTGSLGHSYSSTGRDYNYGKEHVEPPHYGKEPVGSMYLERDENLFYNSRPMGGEIPPTSSYMPPPPVVTEQPRPSLPSLRRGTLESLAERVHAFHGAAPPSALDDSIRRMRAMQQQQPFGYADARRGPPPPHPIRSSSLRMPPYSHVGSGYDSLPHRSALGMRRRPYMPISGMRNLDYSSDTEVMMPSSSATRFFRGRPVLESRVEDNDGAISAPEISTSAERLPTLRSSSPVEAEGMITDPEADDRESEERRRRRMRMRGMGEEDGLGLGRAPSTSAIYERLRGLRSASHAAISPRYTASAENILHSASRISESAGLYSHLPHLGLGRTSASSTGPGIGLGLHGFPLPTSHHPLTGSEHSKILDLNTADFVKYKLAKGSVGTPGDRVSGILDVHLMAGRGLRSSSSMGRGSGERIRTMRDLYCVLEADRIHKARTVVRTGDHSFDWDETFHLDLVHNNDLDFLIYSWDPQYRHKLCYKGSLNLPTLLSQGTQHQLALRVDPRGTLYLKLRFMDANAAYRRTPCPRKSGLFGVNLESVALREGAAASGGVPLILQRCVEEVERRGLDIIGLYRLCGSASKKSILRDAFERNPRTVDLTPDNVPDINVITGVVKDYLRELPEPLVPPSLSQMLAEALQVCLPDDPEGNARLMFSILDCLPRVNRCTLLFLLDHLRLVIAQSDRNKMTAQHVALCFGPLLMLHSGPGPEENMDFARATRILQYLLDIWPAKSGSKYTELLHQFECSGIVVPDVLEPFQHQAGEIEEKGQKGDEDMDSGGSGEGGTNHHS
ncbi:unnamed protein product [Darwinula stevensoni]|uniref:Rho GTPase-activating protein 100F n=1 Tax=Darwinula stevensoni TaxID=69355 RepID=A0A7R9A304_9CRUS|nr:unnamed protein product [Darwinula stevensoni]CAG0880316.1 unnamed protein product [Darwinula stevensoni]